jgi:hypothetical protein
VVPKAEHVPWRPKTLEKLQLRREMALVDGTAKLGAYGDMGRARAMWRCLIYGENK